MEKINRQKKLAKFGEAKRAKQNWNIEDNSPVYQAKISNQGLRYKIACLSVASLRFLATRRLEISWGINYLKQGVVK